MASDSDDVIDVPGQIGKAQQIPPNMMLLKMENESMMAAAVMRPRSPAKIVKQLQDLIDAFPASADDAVYSKPVGKVKRIECAECNNVYEVTANKTSYQCTKCGSKKPPKSVGREIMKFAEGLSIRAAESVRSIFGYTRLATTTEILENGCARITGVFVDYAAGNITSDERIVSNFYTSYQGQKIPIAEDRFLNLNVKAEKSKLRRDIILDSVPNEVKAAFIDMCEKKLTAMVTPEKVEKEILPWFAERGISREHLEKLIGRPLALGWTEDDRLRLKKIAAAIKNEEISVAELLADVDGVKPQGGSKVGESSVGDKFGKDKKPEGADAAPSGGSADANNDVPKFDAAAVVKEFEACKSKTSAKLVYDRLCGPESTLSEDERATVTNYYDVTCARIDIGADKTKPGEQKSLV